MLLITVTHFSVTGQRYIKDSGVKTCDFLIGIFLLNAHKHPLIYRTSENPIKKLEYLSFCYHNFEICLKFAIIFHQNSTFCYVNIPLTAIIHHLERADIQAPVKYC